MPVCRVILVVMRDNIFHDGHTEKAPHRLIILDRDRLTIEFRDGIQFDDCVKGLRASGYMIFSLQADTEPGPWVEPEAPTEPDYLDDLPRRGRKRKLA